MINFLTETREKIEEFGYGPKDILFIGIEETGEGCTWEEFQTLADKKYHEGFGFQKTHKDLIVVFKDGSRLYRYGYDGKEKWKYASVFKMPEKISKIESVFQVPDDELTVVWGGEIIKKINKKTGLDQKAPIAQDERSG